MITILQISKRFLKFKIFFRYTKRKTTYNIYFVCCVAREVGWLRDLPFVILREFNKFKFSGRSGRTEPWSITSFLIYFYLTITCKLKKYSKYSKYRYLAHLICVHWNFFSCSCINSDKIDILSHCWLIDCIHKHNKTFFFINVVNILKREKVR